MSKGDRTLTRTREVPEYAPSWGRVVAGWALIVVATAAAAGAVRAHRFERALPTVRDDAPAVLGVDVGDDRPFEPFTVAVISPAHGDAAAIDRALRRAAESGAGLVVAAGMALPSSPRGTAPLADVLVRHPGTVLLAAADEDGAAPKADERLVALLTPPESWEIHTRGCVVTGELGVVTVSAPGGEHEWGIPVVGSDDPTLRVDLLHVQSPELATRGSFAVELGGSLDSVARGLALGMLWPLAGSGGGLAGVLVAAFLVALTGVRLASRRTHSEGPRLSAVCTASGASHPTAGA